MSADWPSEWVQIADAAERAELEAELTRELPPDHVLTGERVRLLGRRIRRDDYLFELSDGRVAQVHLTWAVETDAFWPFTTIHSSFDEWRHLPDEDR